MNVNMNKALEAQITHSSPLCLFFVFREVIGTIYLNPCCSDKFIAMKN